MKRRAILVLAISATTMVPAAPAVADLPFPVGPPNQPVTYGDCVSTTAAPFGEGVEDYTVDVRTFTHLLKPPGSERPAVEDTIACKGFSPPPGAPGP